MSAKHELVPVESSMMHAVSYVANAQVLTVVFGSGKRVIDYHAEPGRW